MHERIKGWQFKDAPLSNQVREILGTTNLLNGSFERGHEPSLTVFAAEWSAESGRNMSVTHHTPDLCWVGAGWRPASVGQPDRVEMTLGGQVVPFECRVFEAPATGQRELVIWCTVLGGQVLEEAGRWAIETDANEERGLRFAVASRRIAAGQFLDNVRHRRRAAGHKQFVRLSISVSERWQEALDRVRGFAREWLELSVVVNSP